MFLHILNRIAFALSILHCYLAIYAFQNFALDSIYFLHFCF